MYRGGKNTSTPEIWAAGRAVERSQFVLRYERDECNRVAGGLADVVYAVPRAGYGYIIYQSYLRMRHTLFFGPARSFFSAPSPVVFFQKKVFAGTGRIAVNAGSGR